MAESQSQFTYDKDVQSAIRTSLTEPRLEKYLREGGRDFEYTMALYLWNARLCKALQFPIHSLEVTLRNSINHHIMKLNWPTNWAFNDEYLEDLENKSNAAIEAQNRGKRRLLDYRMRKGEYNATVRNQAFRFVPDFGRINTNDVIASLPFEYWVGMLSGPHESDWHETLRTVFPNLPTTNSRRALWLAADKVKELRNRVSHHEPIFHVADLVSSHQSVLELIGMRDQNMKEWVKHHSTFLQVWHDKPRRDAQQSGRKLLAFVEKVECILDLQASVLTLLKTSERKRRNCVVFRQDDQIHLITSDDVSTWLSSCETVGLADLSLPINDFLKSVGPLTPVAILGEESTTGMAHKLFHAPDSKQKPGVIIVTSNGAANGIIRGAVFKPDFTM